MANNIEYNFADKGNIIADYRHSKKAALSNLIFGILGILYGLWLVYNNNDILIWAAVMILLSIGLSIWGIKKLSDNSPVIRIYQNGLWIRRIDFVEWSLIASVDTNTSNYSKSPRLSLNIYLKKFDGIKSKNPDYRVDITNVEYNYSISTTIQAILESKN